MRQVFAIIFSHQDGPGSNLSHFGSWLLPSGDKISYNKT